MEMVIQPIVLYVNLCSIYTLVKKHSKSKKHIKIIEVGRAVFYGKSIWYVNVFVLDKTRYIYRKYLM